MGPVLSSPRLMELEGRGSGEVRGVIAEATGQRRPDSHLTEAEESMSEKRTRVSVGTDEGGYRQRRGWTCEGRSAPQLSSGAVAAPAGPSAGPCTAALGLQRRPLLRPDLPSDLHHWTAAASAVVTVPDSASLRLLPHRQPDCS